jgi:hypothetical protein
VAEVFNRLAPAYGSVVGYFDHFGAKLVERLGPEDRIELPRRVIAGVGARPLTVSLSARFWLAAG